MAGEVSDGSGESGDCFSLTSLIRSKSKSLLIPSTSRTKLSNDADNIERKRFDNLESWSMILVSENVETWEASEDQEEWTADLSQLFIGNKFALVHIVEFTEEFISREQLLAGYDRLITVTGTFDGQIKMIELPDNPNMLVHAPWVVNLVLVPSCWYVDFPFGFCDLVR
ncbi:serine threonine- kinase HT1-like [Olea europaea subsp. europaea]|uniref:Serine threonine- kinase HT1-like n=1 Tax=Olea europaea subsp. europaea TaxID=158383 RepID=A0A8S0UPM3_OLEEU|nr:serine threonine- kinase HT1-like [Olea europaea subsp. europaea]